MTKLRDIKLDDEVALSTIINDSAETTTSTYSSDKIVSLISGLSGGGAILLATTYDETATTGLLFCSQYNVND